MHSNLTPEVSRKTKTSKKGFLTEERRQCIACGDFSNDDVRLSTWNLLKRVVNRVKTKTSENDNVYIVSKRFHVITLTRKKAGQCLKIFHRLRRDGQNFEGRYRLKGYLRETGNQTSMSTYRPPYKFFLCAFTWDRPDFTSVVGPRREILVPVWVRTDLVRVCDNKSQTGSRNFKPVCFSVNPYIY